MDYCDGGCWKEASGSGQQIGRWRIIFFVGKKIKIAQKSVSKLSSDIKLMY